MTSSNTHRLRFLALIIFSSIVLAGCSVRFTGSRSSGGGLYVTPDLGETWQVKNFLRQEGNRVISISSVNIRKIVPDPQRSDKFFLVSSNDGVYVTNDMATTWVPLFGQGNNIRDLAVHPTETYIMYTAINQNLYKTEDGGQTWNVIYQDTLPGSVISAIAIDHFNPDRIIVGTSTGAINVSTNAGVAWHTARRIEGNYVSNIVFAPQDSRTVYAGTNLAGVFRSTDSGENWQGTAPKLVSFPGGVTIDRLLVMPNSKNHLLISTPYGLLETTDAGDTWSTIILLTPPNTARIFALQVNTANPEEIYYAVQGTLYKSLDAGKSWVATPLPNDNTPTAMYHIPGDIPLLYVGFTIIKK